MSPILTVRATDYAGSYVAYTYADGHTETDPPGRPKFKEDVQRDRLIEVARTRTQAVLALRKTSVGIGGVPLPAGIIRQNADAISGSVLFQPYLDQIKKLENIAETSTATPAAVQSLLLTVPIGGKVNSDTSATPEYNQDALPGPVSTPTYSLPFFVTEV